MATREMSADERRAYMESAIDAGGSVLHEGRIIRTKAALPTLGDLAKTEQEQGQALADIERRRQALNDEEVRVRALSGNRQAPAELPEDFPGRASLDDAGHTTIASVNGLSEEELTAIPGIGPATAKKIVEARG